jgi:DNA helicase-2/ATP-dependent DNA helicase PcrA
MLAEEVRAPRGIACITYNNQCVRELKKRLGKLGIEEGSRTFIGTVHSFCLREVIIPYAKLAGFNLPDPLKVATPSEQNRIFSEAVEVVLVNENPQFVRTPFDEFRRTVLDRDSREWTDNDRYPPLIVKYEQLLKKAGKIDFDGMVLAGLELIKDYVWIRKAIKARFPILVVDEYQDLGIPLHQIVIHLCFEGDIRLFAVGDPDQSIYGFTGARPALLNELAEQGNVEEIRLRLNYRCGKTIIMASTTALAEFRDFESAEAHEGVVQGYLCHEGFEEQVKLAVEKIVPEALGRRKGRKLGDIGILYLNQHDGGVIAQAVEKAGLEYVRFDQGNPYQRTPVISWLEDCASWCAGGWKMGEPKLSALLKVWIRFNPSLSKDSETIICKRELVKFLFANRSPSMRLRSWLDAFAYQGLYTRIKNDSTMADESEALKLLYEASGNSNPLGKYSVANFGGQGGSPDRLNLTTIHSAKGLEYDVVIMVGLEQGRIPYYRVTAHQEKEARRLFYVAMTRARHEVHLMWSGWYLFRGNRYSNGRSKFVDEVMEEIEGVVR